MQSSVLLSTIIRGGRAPCAPFLDPPLRVLQSVSPSRWRVAIDDASVCVSPTAHKTHIGCCALNIGGIALEAGRSRFRFPLVPLEFFIDMILRPHYDRGVDSATNRYEYQEYFLGGKGVRWLGLTNLPTPCADCLEICEPQLPGTLRACPGL